MSAIDTDIAVFLKELDPSVCTCSFTAAASVVVAVVRVAFVAVAAVVGEGASLTQLL